MPVDMRKMDTEKVPGYFLRGRSLGHAPFNHQPIWAMVREAAGVKHLLGKWCQFPICQWQVRRTWPSRKRGKCAVNALFAQIHCSTLIFARTVSTLLLTYLLISASSVFAANNSPQRVANGSCVSDQTYKEISATSIEKMANQNKSVNLKHYLISGDRLNISRLAVNDSFVITDSVIRGNMNLVDTVFAGTFDMSGTCVDGALSAERTHFNSGANFTRSVFLKPISLYAATVNGSLTFDGAWFFSQAHFSRIRIKDGAYFTRAHFKDLANFIGAIVDYEGVFEGVVFEKDAAFERAEFGASARFRERPVDNVDFIPAAKFHGVANFKAARIGGQANFIGVEFHDEVRMTRSKFDEAFFWQVKFLPGDPKKAGSNDVLFNDAEFGVLDFGGNGKSANFAPERNLNFSGFIYHRSNSHVRYMLKLLERLGRNYNRQPYNHLEKLYRDSGDPGIASEVYYERRRAEGNRIQASDVLRWGWDRLLRYVFGYGVEMRYPAMWILGLIVFTALWLARRGALEKTDANVDPLLGPYGDSRPFLKRLALGLWISIDLLVPKVNLPGADKWRPRPRVIQLFRFQLPITYKELASLARFTGWLIITVSLGLFSISDFVKN